MCALAHAKLRKIYSKLGISFEPKLIAKFVKTTGEI
jgi:hypothetical protein